MIDVIFKLKSGGSVKKEIKSFLKNLTLSEIVEFFADNKPPRNFTDDNSGIKNNDIDFVAISNKKLAELVKSLSPNSLEEVGLLIKGHNLPQIHTIKKGDEVRVYEILSILGIDPPSSLLPQNVVENKIDLIINGLQNVSNDEAKGLVLEVKKLFSRLLSITGSQDTARLSKFNKIITEKFGDIYKISDNDLIFDNESMSGEQLYKELKNRKIDILSIPRAKQNTIYGKIQPYLSDEEKQDIITAFFSESHIKILKYMTGDLLVEVSKRNPFNNSLITESLRHVNKLTTKQMKIVGLKYISEYLEFGLLNKGDLTDEILEADPAAFLSQVWVIKDEKLLLKIVDLLKKQNIEPNFSDLIDAGFVKVQKKVIELASKQFITTVFKKIDPSLTQLAKNRLMDDLKGSEALILLGISDFLDEDEFGKIVKLSAQTVDGAIDILTTTELTNEKLRLIAIKRLLKSKELRSRVLSLDKSMNITDSEIEFLSEWVVESKMSSWDFRNISHKIFSKDPYKFVDHFQHMIVDKTNINGSEEFIKIIISMNDRGLEKRIFSNPTIMNIIISGNMDVKEKVRLIELTGYSIKDNITFLSGYGQDLYELSKHMDLEFLFNPKTPSEYLNFFMLGGSSSSPELEDKRTLALAEIIKLEPIEFPGKIIYNIYSRVKNRSQLEGVSNFLKWALNNVEFLSLCVENNMHTTLVANDEALNYAITHIELSTKIDKNQKKTLLFQIAEKCIEHNKSYFMSNLDKFCVNDTLNIETLRLLIGRKSDMIDLDNNIIFKTINANIQEISVEEILDMRGSAERVLSLILKRPSSISLLSLIDKNVELKKLAKLHLQKNGYSNSEIITKFSNLCDPSEIDTSVLSDINPLDNITYIFKYYTTADRLYSLSNGDDNKKYIINHFVRTTGLSGIITNEFSKLFKDSYFQVGLLNDALKTLTDDQIGVGLRAGSLSMRMSGIDDETIARFSRILKTTKDGEQVSGHIEISSNDDKDLVCTLNLTSGDIQAVSVFNNLNTNSPIVVVSTSVASAIKLSNNKSLIRITGTTKDGKLLIDLDRKEITKSVEDYSKKINALIKSKNIKLTTSLQNKITNSIKWYVNLEFLNSTSEKVKSPLFLGEDGYDHVKSIIDSKAHNKKLTSFNIVIKPAYFGDLQQSDKEVVIEMLRDITPILRLSGAFSADDSVWGEADPHTSVSFGKDGGLIVSFSGVFSDGNGIIKTIKTVLGLVERFCLAGIRNLSEAASEASVDLDYDKIMESDFLLKNFESALGILKNN